MRGKAWEISQRTMMLVHTRAAKVWEEDELLSYHGNVVSTFMEGAISQFNFFPPDNLV